MVQTLPVTALPLTDRERSFLAYWNSLGADRSFPERAWIIPENLGPWLGWLHLLEVLEDGRDFVYRVHGSEPGALTGFHHHLKRVSDWDELRRTRALKLYGMAVESARPIFVCETEDFGQNLHRTFSRVVVPLGPKDADRPSHLLSLLTNHEAAWEHDHTVIDPVVDPSAKSGS